tara:strand:- start:1011 stop:1520 length:510 start_codon:yes stop_codon:yes gene_type:complete
MGIFKGLVAPQRNTFKVLKSVDAKGTQSHEYHENVIELKAADSGLPGTEASKMLSYFVDSKLSGDTLLNNYSFYITANDVSASLAGKRETKRIGKKTITTKVIEPMQVLTLQHLRDAVKSLGKHLLVECVQTKFTSYPKPKLCIHDARKTQSERSTAPKSVNTEFKDFS